MKKLFAILLCLCTVTFVIVVPSFAGESGLDNGFYGYSVNAIQRYIEFCSLTPNTGFSISQAVPINNSQEPDTHAVFLFDGDDCIGIMLIAFVGDEFASSFIPGNFPQVSAVSIADNPFALLSNGDCLYLLTESSCNALTGQDEFSNNIRYGFSDFNAVRMQKTTVIVSIDSKGERGINAIGNQLDVDIVYNSSSPDTGKGLCWAASVAAIIRYRTSSHTLTALGLYNILKGYYPPQQYGYPLGYPIWEQRGFSCFSLSNTTVSSPPSFSTIRSIIDSSRPIYYDMSANNPADGTVARHGIVVVGYGAAYGYYNYILMDPNVHTGYVVVAGSGSGSLPFIYVTSSLTYNIFNHYIY